MWWHFRKIRVDRASGIQYCLYTISRFGNFPYQIITTKRQTMKLLKTLAGLILCATIASLIVILLFIYSERKLHTDNNFTRRFLPYAVKQETTKNIRFNSHYFAGVSNDRIFLANVAAPSLIHVYDNKLNKLKGGNINLFGAESIPFQSIQVKIKAPHFFVLDGTVP